MGLEKDVLHPSLQCAPISIRTFQYWIFPANMMFILIIWGTSISILGSEEGSTEIEYSNPGSTSGLVSGWGFSGEFMGYITRLLGSGKNFQGVVWFIQLSKEKDVGAGGWGIGPWKELDVVVLE